MYKVEYKSLFTGQWVASWLGCFSTIRRAENAAKALVDYETRVVLA
jgi:hypothetical protein